MQYYFNTMRIDNKLRRYAIAATMVTVICLMLVFIGSCAPKYATFTFEKENYEEDYGYRVSNLMQELPDFSLEYNSDLQFTQLYLNHIDANEVNPFIFTPQYDDSEPPPVEGYILMIHRPGFDDIYNAADSNQRILSRFTEDYPNLHVLETYKLNISDIPVECVNFKYSSRSNNCIMRLAAFSHAGFIWRINEITYDDSDFGSDTEFKHFIESFKFSD